MVRGWALGTWAILLVLLVACGTRTVDVPDAPRMVTYRADHSTTLLWDGRVLVAGGRDAGGRPLASAEIYDPHTGTWTPTGAMSSARYGHTASVLLDGRVLVAGGSGCRRNCSAADSLTSAELYDPNSGTWGRTTSMSASRINHTASVLSDGRVLIAGGRGLEPNTTASAGYPLSLRSAELYDPQSGRWSAAASMQRNRSDHLAAILWDGRAVVAGGFDGTFPAPAMPTVDDGWSALARTSQTLEVYNPQTNTWTLSMRAPSRDIAWIGVRSDNSLLVLGGFTLEKAQVYNPNTNRWFILPDRTGLPAEAPTLVLLDDARVLATGGFADGETDAARASAEVAILQGDAEEWMPVEPMRVPRVRHTAVRLPDGRVLVFGGHQYHDRLLRRTEAPVVTSEIYDPESDRWTARGP
jgi:hypothetical protein